MAANERLWIKFFALKKYQESRTDPFPSTTAMWAYPNRGGAFGGRAKASRGMDAGDHQWPGPDGRAGVGLQGNDLQAHLCGRQVRRRSVDAPATRAPQASAALSASGWAQAGAHPRHFTHQQTIRKAVPPPSVSQCCTGYWLSGHD